MKNVEHAEERILASMETGDKEGTYEQKKGSDVGSQTVFTGTQSKTKVIVLKTQKPKQLEEVVFTD